MGEVNSATFNVTYRTTTMGIASERLGVPIDDLKKLGELIMPNPNPQFWQGVHEGTVVKPATLAFMIAALKLSGILAAGRQMNRLPEVCNFFRPILSTIAEVLLFQVNGIELPPIILTVSDYNLIMLTDAEGDAKGYNLRENKEITDADLRKQAPPIESYAVALTALFGALMGKDIFNNLGALDKSHREVEGIPEPNLPQTDIIPELTSDGETVQHNPFNPREE